MQIWILGMLKLTKITRIHWPSINTMEIQFLIRWIFHDVGITKKNQSLVCLYPMKYLGKNLTVM